MNVGSLRPTVPAEQYDDLQQQAHAATVGMWVFLVSEMLFFGALFFAYSVTRFEMPEAFAAASRYTDVVLGTTNTAVLLTSSLTMALAARAAQLDARRAVSWLLTATAVLGLVFLLIKGIEYSKEIQENLLPGDGFQFTPAALEHGAELFYFLYFLMTGVHAVHLLIGIGAALTTAWRVRPSASHPADSNWVEGVGLYWHLVDIVWVFLYPMLYLVSRSS